MADFLLVVPQGWTQLDWQYVTNNLPDMSVGNVLDWINSNSLSYIEERLKSEDLIPQTATVVEAKLFDDTFFMVRLG